MRSYMSSLFGGKKRLIDGGKRSEGDDYEIDRFLQKYFTVEPSELRFTAELGKQLTCPLRLSAFKYTIAFKVTASDPNKYSVRPNIGFVLPESTCDIIVTMKSQREFPEDMQCKDKFFIESAIGSGEETALDVFNEDSRRYIHKRNLRVVYVSPLQSPSPIVEGFEEDSSPSTLVSDDGNSNTSDLTSIPKEDEPEKQYSEIRKEYEEPEKQYSEIKKNHSHQQSNARSESIETYLTVELERNTPKRFSHEELMKFTSGFADKVGRGGFGSVYRGKFLNGTEIVVKVLKENDFVEETFLAEVSTMLNTCHRYLVKCYGYYFDPTMKALVYEYMENGSLDEILYGNPRKLEWKTFYKIAIKTAKGLSYLHDGCDNQIIHHDLKPANVLIDKHLCAKIADFGVARIMVNNVDHVTWTKLRGTPGYIAPEMIMPDSKITYKCDVYSFGMMLFEILGMRSNGGGLDWFPRQVWSKFESGELDQIIDDCGIHKEKYRVRAKVVSKVALWCAQHTPQARPSMSTVVKMLEEVIPVTEPPNPFYSAPEWSYSKFSPSSSLDKKSK